MSKVVTFTPKPREENAPVQPSSAAILLMPLAAPQLNIRRGFRLEVTDLSALATVAQHIRDNHDDLSSNAESFLEQMVAKALTGKSILSVKQVHWLWLLAGDINCHWNEGQAFLDAYATHREARI